MKRKQVILEDIFQSYFIHDVQALADFRNLGKIRDLLYLLVSRIGSQLSITTLSETLQISRETVYNYLEFLEGTYFISLIHKHSSISRRVAGTSKLYFCDTGIASLFGELSDGQRLENSVFQNLRTDHKLSYYRRDSQHEIDFVVDDKIALEVKQTARQADIHHLSQRAANLKNVNEFYIVSKEFVDKPEVILACDLV